MRNALVLPTSANGTDCNPILHDGEQCSAICSEQYESVGFFTCSEQQFVGESHCLMLPPDAVVETVTKVAGTMEIEIDLLGNISQDVLEDTFKGGIADALGVSMED